MAFDGTDSCWNPTWPIDIDREPRLQIAKFGDGYEQRMLDGINWMTSTWKLKWSMRPHDVLIAMDDYLTDVQADAFPFLDPHSQTLVMVFCDKWSISWSYRGNSADYGDLSAEFRNANGRGV
jgi:phage-related protein